MKELNNGSSIPTSIDIKKVLDIGTPTIDFLLKPNDDIVKKIYKEYPRLKKKINILYAPTFRSDGSNNADE